MCEKQALLPKKRIFGTSASFSQGRIQGGGRSPTLKSRKVTLFTMVLYNSENNISKPIPNKTFVMFELFYCSRYKAVLSSIVLSQQCSEAYIISSYSSEADKKLTTTEIYHPNFTSWTHPASKVRNCAVPPDHLHSENSFSRTCNLPKHWKNRKTRRSYLN